jgi:hypothetical protein
MGLDRGVHEVSGTQLELPLRTTVLRGNRMRVIRGYALTVGDGSALLLRLAIQKEEYVSPPFWAATRPTSKTEGEQCA